MKLEDHERDAVRTLTQNKGVQRVVENLTAEYRNAATSQSIAPEARDEALRQFWALNRLMTELQKV